MLTIPDLIAGLGGTTKVATACGIQPSAVSNWVARDSIAAQHQITIWRMAEAAGLDWAPPGAAGMALVEKGAAA